MHNLRISGSSLEAAVYAFKNQQTGHGAIVICEADFGSRTYYAKLGQVLERSPDAIHHNRYPVRLPIEIKHQRLKASWYKAVYAPYDVFLADTELPARPSWHACRVRPHHLRMLQLTTAHYEAALSNPRALRGNQRSAAWLMKSTVYKSLLRLASLVPRRTRLLPAVKKAVEKDMQRHTPVSIFLWRERPGDVVATLSKLGYSVRKKHWLSVIQLS